MISVTFALAQPVFFGLAFRALLTAGSQSEGGETPVNQVYKRTSGGKHVYS